ncbi:MAG: DUF1588 domain-containing protein [Verrucomicrobiales bacterium]|nr:DUF1588 domain-containing protein [Verrucomicrobiales bacterium]
MDRRRGKPESSEITTQLNDLLMNNFCIFALIALIVLTGTSRAETELVGFLETYCADCHNPEKKKGKIDLTPLIKNPDLSDAGFLQGIHDAVSFEDMPPEDETQPTGKERADFLAAVKALMTASGSEFTEKSMHPGLGNYVDHKTLFTEPKVRKAATPVRLWRMSPHIFMQHANSLSRAPLLRVQNNQGSDGLHPAFAYMTPPHTFRDHAEAHVFEEATTELLFDVCWQIAGLQVAGKRQPAVIKAFTELKEPQAEHWRQIIRTQFHLAMRSEPSEEETAALVSLAEKTQADTGPREALQTLLTAILLKPEAVYRFELGTGDPDEFGRVFLAPHELKYALAYALTDHVPDAALEKAAGRGQLTTRADVRREAERLLADHKASEPRLLRFFQEYFEYPGAAEVFKDNRRANAVFANERIRDADLLVLHILNEDRDVLKRLLTEDSLFIESIPSEPVERRYRVFHLPDYGFPRQWKFEENQPVKPPIGKRSGILTHPAWLLSFSDNEKNQAIQRGRWVQMKLLGGIVPDTPIGVDAKLPTDPHLTLREKMNQVTRAEYCWTCHKKMDPLGLPFEQFDDFGRFRETELDRPIDTTGEVAVGVDDIDGLIGDPFEMLERFAHSEHVEQVFVRHVFRYFLGRNESVDDAPTLIDAHLAYRDSNGSMRALVLSLLTSDSFLYRQLPETRGGVGRE